MADVKKTGKNPGKSQVQVHNSAARQFLCVIFRWVFAVMVAVTRGVSA